MSRVLSFAAHPWSAIKTWLPITCSPKPITACAFCEQPMADTDLVCAVPTTRGWVTTVVHDDCLDAPGCLAKVHGKHDPRYQPDAFVSVKPA